ncbi:hypothetical protein G6M26_28000 [Agrobacterium tumefaciens]|nr:hypothetical protein [Agrobacterium tumefaciens]NTE22396.1 hypothetical protein [Agrobacterium tumefaciens]
MDKELIEHITTQLQNHEEHYVPGAWERFSEKEENKRRGFVLWPLWTAAAIIFIISGIFFIHRNEESQQPGVVKSKVQNIESPIAKKVEENAHSNESFNQGSKSVGINHTEKQAYLPSYSKSLNSNLNIHPKQDVIVQTYHPAEEFAINKTNNLVAKPADIKMVDANQSTAAVQAEKQKPETNKKLSFEDLLAVDSKINQQHPTHNKTEQHSKWQPDVYVAPSMGNDNKLNMNYGFSLSYAIANKVSISSGVSYASISSTESQNAAAPQSLSGKNLASINAKVQGINVPLEVRYNISDKLYTGIGVSALAVLNNAQQNTYLVNQVQTLSSPLANGTMDSKSFIVAEKQSEPQPTSTIDPDKYIGFYNFSLGYKQKISKKNNIAIEPFLRLPMKTFSKENLNLTNGGLRLKVDF